jgi:hypothetical protein
MASREATCHCGQLRVTTTADPFIVSICHCTACQRRTGSAFGMQAAFRPDEVEITGRHHDYTRISDEADRKEHIFHFCPDCGSQVFGTEPTEPDIVVVSVGSFADPDFPPPTESGYDFRRQRWFELPESVKSLGPDFDLWGAKAKQLYEEGRYADAAAEGRALIERHPDEVYLRYNVACCESRAGRPAEAVAQLRQAIAGWEGFREMARGDDDFAAIRDDAGFRELTGA